MKRLVVVLSLVCAAWSQVATNANKQYQTKDGRDAVAKGLADPARDERQKPREIIEAMDLKPGMTVADVGTGVGYMIPFLSRAVGPKGKVIGEDIAQDFLDKAKERARLSNVTNATFVLGTATDAKLPGDAVNAILLLDVYHHFDYPDQMLASLRSSLLGGGKLYIVDYMRTLAAMPNGRALEHIRLDRDEVIQEVQDNGFRLLFKNVLVPNSQYILGFEKK